MTPTPLQRNEKVISVCCEQSLEMRCNPDGQCRYVCVGCDKTHKYLDKNFNPVNPPRDKVVFDTFFESIDKDIRDRRGLKNEWDSIDADTKEEIKDKWLLFFSSALATQRQEVLEEVEREAENMWSNVWFPGGALEQRNRFLQLVVKIITSLKQRP